MKTGKILLILLLSFNCYALSFQNRLYSPVRNVKNLSFKIKSDSITKLVAKKLKKKDVKVYAQVYWSKGKTVVQLHGVDNLSGHLKNSIKQAFSTKARLAVSEGFKKENSSMTYKKEKGDWYNFYNYDGKVIKNHTLLKNKGNKVTVIDKLPTGTFTTNYHYKKVTWSKKRVLYKVTQKSFEGTQVEKVTSSIGYKTYERKYRFVSYISSNVTQRVSLGRKSEADRVFKEKFVFYNYIINKQAGLRLLLRNDTV